MCGLENMARLRKVRLGPCLETKEAADIVKTGVEEQDFYILTEKNIDTEIRKGKAPKCDKRVKSELKAWKITLNDRFSCFVPDRWWGGNAGISRCWSSLIEERRWGGDRMDLKTIPSQSWEMAFFIFPN